jgi:hypothetical protein
VTVNGRLPSSALAVIPVTDTLWTDRVAQYTPAAALPYLEAAAAAFFDRTGVRLFIFRAYRSYQEQVRLLDGWRNHPGEIDPVTGVPFAMAADPPGSSNHGDDVEPAFDIWSGVDVAGSDANRAWVEVSAPYGFAPVGMSFGNPEPWHHTWRRDRVTAALPIRTTLTEQDDDMRHLQFGPHLYSIAPGYARHHRTGREALAARKITGGKLIALSQTDAEAAFAAFGIPRSMATPAIIDAKGLGGTWTASERARAASVDTRNIARDVLDALKKIADKLGVRL